MPLKRAFINRVICLPSQHYILRKSLANCIDIYIEINTYKKFSKISQLDNNFMEFFPLFSSKFWLRFKLTEKKTFDLITDKKFTTTLIV